VSRPGHIFLVGFMGAGKTTVGRLLAALMDLPYLDLDDEIQRVTGAMVSEIFASGGEDAFRIVETEALLGLSSVPKSVVACGGGVVLRPENRAALGEMGTVVYLQVTAAEALARIGDASTRPLLAGPGGALAVTALLGAREALYRTVADIEVDTAGQTPDEVARLIQSALGD